MIRQRIAVIGGVAAGPAAAAEAARVDPDAEVVLYEQGPHISYSACEMPYFVAGAFDNPDDLIAYEPRRFEKEKRVKVEVHHKVVELLPARERIVVHDLSADRLREERFDKFILAMGARARVPEIDGVEAENVIPIRRLQDAVRLRHMLDREEIRHVVILGGGYIGIEMAEAMRAHALRVTILEPAGSLLNRHLDPPLRRLVDERVRQNGVTVRPERATSMQSGRDGLIDAVRTDRGEVIGCQLVLICMGITPNVEVATAAGIRLGESGAVAVDDAMRTNLPNVWACGDMVEVRRVIDDAKVHLALSPTAFRTARVAARNAARRGRGAPVKFPGVCIASAVRAFGLEVAAVGLRIHEAEEAGFDVIEQIVQHSSRATMYPGGRSLHVRLLLERRDGRILGAELLGDEGAALRANVLVPLIRNRATVFEMRDLDLIYNPPIAPSMDILIVAANEAAKKVESGSTSAATW